VDLLYIKNKDCTHIQSLIYSTTRPTTGKGKPQLTVTELCNLWF